MSCDAMPLDAILVLCTCPSESSARQLAGMLLTARLAACVSIVPGVQSFYRWQGQLEQAEEWQLVIKSRASLFEPLRQALRAAHPYEVPEILALPIGQIDADYLAWLHAETGPEEAEHAE